MKREICAAVLLLLLIAAAALNTLHIDRLTDLVETSLTRAENAAEQGDFETALVMLENALSVWQGDRDYTDVFLRHPDLDAASDAFYELEELLRQKDADALPAVFKKLRYHLESIDYMEHLSVGTIF